MWSGHGKWDEIPNAAPPQAGYQHPRWDGEMGGGWGGGWGVVREMSLTTLVTRESRPWVRKASSLIYHAPLNPLFLEPSQSAFLFFYFLLALYPPCCWQSNFTSLLLVMMKRRECKNGLVQSWLEMRARWHVGSRFQGDLDSNDFCIEEK